ncbi:MAG: ribosomal RNA small subunit methyltransferase A [Candidatus Buchananbacteria bacterium RIFCSPHIGHO2_02_FULL_38_8]|uniref:Ribosomal RNA small subunit methyltransferase A n=2 Tax=Candidatus Buchananiibacteriota TaxID=1817903 RepID=A0A1G1XVG4_9BACT|nr:MAG: ribosomal RNA small subunit methyltransferase A [Candidatus Buchananbacteria bacterium RIFCSPHIGHO2_01_FULL_39_8]OGY47883.1 MAG: ribosomal RNA small subunit methyltransferase A [Candidatus Buchananbacteria bacterium RIFCSPHIGHO2_02_FULL_38_8]
MIQKIKQICQAYGIRPQRSKGQNFLVSQEVLDQIIQVADLKSDDVILEVGPGFGILTEALIEKVKKVISVELDKKLFSFLQAKFSEVKNLELVNEDILKLQPTSYNLQATTYKIVANIPYNITSKFLRKFLSQDHKPFEMVLLVQKEVANRVCAPTGKMSLLSVSVQLYGQPEIIEVVDKKNFWPEPEVDSAILKISDIKNTKEITEWLVDITEKQFWQVVKIGFSARRKKLSNNLSAGLRISAPEVKNTFEKIGLDHQIRAQNLEINDWVKLAKTLKIYLN